MNKPGKLGLCVALLFVPLVLFCQGEDRTAKVDEIFAKWNKRETPGCAVAVAENGRTVLSRAYGMADLEHDVANTPETVFEAGSVSKQFTAAAVLLLVQQGKLSRDDDVRKVVPELPSYGQTITLDHLIHHTSGLRDWGVVAAITGWPRGSRIHTHDHVLDIAGRQKALNYPPGAEYSYTNTGYNLLAVIVERVSGKSFADFTRQELFGPVGMTKTQWRDDFTRIVKDRAVAYEQEDGAYHSSMPFENVHGNGGLLTTVGDLLTWTENYVTAKLGGPAFVAALEKQGRLADGREINYAGGLFVNRYRGVPEISHGGATAGYRAFLARFPEQKLSIALLCNAAEADTADLAHRTIDLFLPAAETQAAASPKVVEVKPEVLSARAGLYRNLRTGEPLELKVTEGKLTTGGGRVLQPLSDSLFWVDEGLSVDVDGGTDGRPTTLQFKLANGDVIAWEAVAPASPTPVQLAEYVGDYRSDEAEVTYRVELAEGKLSLHRRPSTKHELTPLYVDAFRSAIGWLVRFVRDSEGKVSELSLGLGRVRDLRLGRVKP